MSRPKKEHKMCTIKMDVEIADKLDSFCEMSGQTKTFVIEQAILNYMEEFNALYQKMNKSRTDRQ